MLSAELLKAVPLVREIDSVTTQLIAAAYTDTLTGLLTRNAYQAITSVATPDALYGAVYFDLSGFKAINDAHSHDAGDAALSWFGQRLLVVSSAHGALPFRLGGDEFALLVPEGGYQAVSGLLVELRETSFEFNGAPLSFTASIGHAPPDAEATPEAVIQRAEAASRVSKAKGGDVPVAWTSSLGSAEKRVQRRKRCTECEAGLTLHVPEVQLRPGCLDTCPNCRAPL